MTDSFQRIREALRLGNVADLRPEDFSESVHIRLVRALADVGRPGAVGPSDIASLVGHLLARESAHSGGARQTVDVPRDENWPSKKVWELAGLHVVDLSDNRVLSGSPWRPSWLPHADVVSPGASAFAEASRRNYSEVSGDPCLQLMDLGAYRCAGQREAMRAVFSMPTAATLVINIPTGGGKSLCVQVPALHGSESGLTIVVVPTIALAIDQERALLPWVGHQTAFFNTSSVMDGRRSGILSRIFQGIQRIVFTSPEALLGSLRPALYAMARQGLIRYLVVDEAHMVEQWGDEFRSSFQELAGLRSDLIRNCPDGSPFKTVLLTATLTSACLATLKALFSTSDREFQTISAVQIRPEPEYWVAHAPTEEDRERMVCEAIYRLPRSLLLYVTQPWRAEQWKNRLRALGFSRCESVTGQTPTADRERVIRQWRERDTDIVVATSAFGLGMDQLDVRSVVHACVPENVDRFYQEVGRGGRDGKASVSLAVYTYDDVSAARRINRSTIIGIGRGRQRWLRMFSDHRRVSLGGGRHRVRVDVVPSLLPGDIDMVNKYNVQWNVRTLTLMTRAGLIALDCEPPAPPIPREHQGTSNSVEESTQSRVIRIVDEHHSDEDVWRKRVGPARHLTAQRDGRAFTQMLDVLAGERCLGEVFETAYRIAESGTDHEFGARIRVGRSCGGCPWCRQTGRRPYVGDMPLPLPVWPPQRAIGLALQTLLGGKSAAVFYEESPTDKDLDRLIDWLIGQGCRTLIGPDSTVPEWIARYGRRRDLKGYPFVIGLGEYEPLTAPRLPSVVLSGPMMTLPEYLIPRNNAEVPAVLILPRAIRDANHPSRFLRDSLRLRRYSLEEFQSLIGL